MARDDRHAWETPDELVCSLFDDCVFEGFIEQFAYTFLKEQTDAITGLRNAIYHWSKLNPGWADPIKTLSDPDWDAVREAAQSFQVAFTRNWQAMPLAMESK